MTRKIAIVGLGAAARTIHLPAYRGIAGIEVVGGVDPRARDGEFPFPLFGSAAEMLERTRPDILAIATPPDAHYGLIAAGLDAGAHVFCEKPFVDSLEQADEVLALAERAGRFVVVNNEFRFMNIHMAAKKRIAGPEFGDLLFLALQQTFFVTEATEAGWRGEDPRRTCKDFGTHALDLCRYFFGEDPRSISARMPRAGDPAGPDYLNLIQLEFSGDRVAHITLDRLSRGPHRYLETRLDGTVACIETGIGGRIELRAGIRGGTRRPYARFDLALGGQARLYRGERFRVIATDPLDLFAHATGRLMREFLRALDEGRTPPCGAADNRRTLALMLAAYESDATGAPVVLGG